MNEARLRLWGGHAERRSRVLFHSLSLFSIPWRSLIDTRYARRDRYPDLELTRKAWTGNGKPGVVTIQLRHKTLGCEGCFVQQVEAAGKAMMTKVCKYRTRAAPHLEKMRWQKP